MKQIVKKAFLFSSIIALASFATSNAKAGFEWRPPQDNQTQNNAQGNVQAQPTPAPVPQVIPQPVAPVQKEIPQQIIIQQPAVQQPVIQQPVVKPQIIQQELAPSLAPQQLTPKSFAPEANAPQQIRVQNLQQPIAPPVEATTPTPLVPQQLVPQQMAPQVIPQQEAVVAEQPVRKSIIVRPVTMPPVAPQAAPIPTPVEEKPAAQIAVKKSPVLDKEFSIHSENASPLPVAKPVAKIAPVLAKKDVSELTEKKKGAVVPVLNMDKMHTEMGELNRPIRVKRDPLPALYSDEAPIILGKTPRERMTSSAYQTAVVSETNNVTIFDPDSDVPMPQYSDIETPKEFARGFDDNFASSAMTPSVSVTAAPQSILPAPVISEAIVEEPTQFAVSAPVQVEALQPVPSSLKSEDYQMASPLPVVSRSVVQEPVQKYTPAPAPQFVAVEPAAQPVAEPTLMPVPTDGTVQGFGKRVPLVIAVRQIAPEGYEFDFGQGVDMGALVDWQGGQAWENVMESTLSNYGLVSSTNETTKIVSVYKPGQVAASKLPVPTMAPVATSPAVMTQAYEPVAIAPDPYAEARSASLAVERQVESTPVAAPMPVEEPRHNNATIVSNTTDFASARVVPTTKDTPVIAPVKVAQELPPVTYQAPVSQAADGGAVWYGAKDSTLRSVLRDWASKANVELYWDSQFDYPLQATVVVKGTFEDAVQRVLEGFEQAQPRPLGRLHKNSDNGPDVLIVEANDLID